MKPFNPRNSLGIRIMSLINGYNHEKYWSRREIVINPESKKNIFIKLYFLFYIKRIDVRHNCSFGTNVHSGSKFANPPLLPHGPNGIIVGHDVKVGSSCVIYHQVTIAHGNVVIGDFTEIGAGAKVLSNVTIGKHVHVGANCVVVEDIPDYATVVIHKPRIILKVL